jgi:hypothetical protein
MYLSVLNVTSLARAWLLNRCGSSLGHEMGDWAVARYSVVAH